MRSLAVLFIFLLATSANAQPWDREIYTIPFEDESANPYRHPLFGGYNTPTLSFGDVDNDGDQDLFVQDTSNELAFFENISTGGPPDFRLRTSQLGGVEIFSWFAIADINNDGYADILADEPSNAIRYYENDGSSSISFTLKADTLRDTNGVTISPDLASRPVVRDFDCNGELDLFLGRQDGTISRFEMDNLTPERIPVFQFIEDNFQNILVLGGFGKNGSAHGANAIAIGDLNGDGLPDLVWGDFFEPSLVQFVNTATCEAFDLERTADTLQTASGYTFLTGGLNAPEMADVDSDGDADLVVGVLSNKATDAVRNTYYFEQSGSGLQLLSDRWIDGVDVGKKSKPTLADLDNDGDLDLLIGNDITSEGSTGSLVYFENTGTSTDPSYILADSLFANVTHGFGLAPSFGDLDGDGDMDLVVGSFSGLIALYTNVGDDTAYDFELSTLDFTGVDVGSASVPVLTDLDADGDLDLVVGESSGTLNYFENIGDATTGNFVEDASLFAGIDIGQRSTTAFMDLDQDGDLDMLVGTQRDGIRVFTNTGSASQPAFAPGTDLSLYTPREAAPLAADIDNDSDVDLIIGTDGGGLVFYRNNRIKTSVVAEHPDATASLHLYPNPVTINLTVEVQVMTGVSAADIDVRLVDALGRVVASRLLVPGNEPRTFVFPTASLTAGVYFVTVTGVTARPRKFVKVE